MHGTITPREGYIEFDTKHYSGGEPTGETTASWESAMGRVMRALITYGCTTFEIISPGKE